RVRISPGEVIECGDTMLMLQRVVSTPESRRLWPFARFEGKLEELCQNRSARTRDFAVMRVQSEATGEALRRILTELLGAGDVVGSYGPEEYALLVVGSARARIQSLAERLREQLPDARMGIAVAPDDGATAQALISRACATLRGSSERATRSDALVVEDP